MIGDADTVRTVDPSTSQHGEQIDQLLDEIHALVGPAAWPRIEALVTALVGLYGEGLERLLAHARDVAPSREGLDEKLVADELVSSLLLVHGLHPVGLEQRIELALDRLRTELPATVRLELVEVEDSIVKLRPALGSDGYPPSMHVVARAIEHEAPEVAGIQIDGLPPPPPPVSDIVPIERLRRGGRP